MIRRTYGPTAWLIEEIDQPSLWALALTRLELAGIVDIIPSESAVVVCCIRDLHRTIGDVLDSVVAESGSAGADDRLTIDVVYDGPDLTAVAERTGLDVEDVVRLHSAGCYDVAFCGFSPGFGYLRGLDEGLHLPRRATPRREVPAGAVGIAAGYSCVYPSPSPGGWHLIGRTELVLWNVDEQPPALLRPGRNVCFRDITP